MVKSIKLIVCISLKYDADLIPHFCKHYSKYNIDTYHIILHNNEDFDLLDYHKYFINIKNFKITFNYWVGEFNCIDKIDKFNKIIDKTNESHILLTDVDEFQNHYIPLKEDYIWGDLIDREPKGSKVKKVTSEDISSQFPLKTKISGWNNTIKPCIFPSSERLLSSHYITTPYNNQNLINIDHYRWTESRLAKSKERYNIHSRLNKDNITFPSGHRIDAKESRRVYNRLEKKSVI